MERLGDGFPIVLKIEKAFSEGLQPGEVVGRENLALHDGEVDLDLVKPTGMNGSVHKPQTWEPALEATDGGLTAMSRAIVNDPEHTAGLVIGGPGHDLLDQTVKWGDAAAGFAAAKDPSLMDIQSGQVGPGATALVFVFDPRRQARPRGQRGMLAAAGLDAGFFVSGEDEFIVLEGFAVPRSFIKVEQAAGLADEVGVARKDPTAVVPGANGVLVQPPPDGAFRDAGDQAGLTDLAPEVARAPARQGDALGGWQLTGKGFDLNDQFWGEKSGADPDGRVLRGRPNVARRTVYATG